MPKLWQKPCKQVQFGAFACVLRRRALAGDDTERAGGRAAIEANLPDCIRFHSDDMERIVEEIRELGYPHAAAILAERMPRSACARAGELGEILATELVDEKFGYTVPA